MTNNDYFLWHGFLCGAMAGIELIAVALLIAGKLGLS